MIFDQFPDQAPKEIDVCVVGAGPVGLSFALSLARRGVVVHLLEAGGRDTAANATGEFGFDVANAAIHANASLVSRQGLGGTSTAWGGGCMPLAPIDLSARTHVPLSGAPISYDEIAVHHEEAGELLGVDGHYPPPETEGCVDHSSVMRISRNPNTAALHQDEIERLENLKVYLNTRALSLAMDPATGTVTALKITSRGTASTIKPKRTILCCGGIQSTRLLLLLQREHPQLLGGEAGPLGRYYNGHISGAAARICFDRPSEARKYLVRQREDGTLERNCIALGPEIQISKGLMNLYFGLTHFPISDPGYRSSALSAIHLALSLRHRTAHYMPYYHSGHVTTEYEFGLNPLAHLRNVVARPDQTILGVAGVLRQKKKNGRVGPFAKLFNVSGIYALRYHAEQAPNPDSRVTLSDKTDSRGIPLPSVDLRISAPDVKSVIESHLLLDLWMRKTGLGRIEWHHSEEKRFEQIKSQSSDGYHQMGLTRMASSHRTGVVDRKLQVHGLSNLYIAAPSILPTGGRAHPTFPTVALAVRLADHLASGPR